MKRIFFLMVLSSLMFSNLVLADFNEDCSVYCNDGICNKIIGQTYYVLDNDGVCKPYFEANSLMNSNIKAIVKSDGINEVKIIDYNFTSIIAEISTKELDKNIPIKTYSDEIELPEKEFIIDSSKNNVVKIPYVFGETIHIGKDSTTIILQRTNNMILEDSYIDSFESNTNYDSENSIKIHSYPSLINYKWGIIKFNSTELIGKNIISAFFYPHIQDNMLDLSTEGYNMTICLSENQSWKDTEVTWNNYGGYGTESEDYFTFFGGTGEPIGFITPLNITAIVQENTDKEYENLSLILKSGQFFGTPTTSDYVRMYSVEFYSSYYLNVTYEEPPLYYNNISLIFPTNNTIYNNPITNFSFILDTNIDSSNCSLFVNDALRNYNDSVINGTETILDYNITIEDTYEWYINCDGLYNSSLYQFEYYIPKPINLEIIKPTNTTYYLPHIDIELTANSSIDFECNVTNDDILQLNFNENFTYSDELQCKNGGHIFNVYCLSADDEKNETITYNCSYSYNKLSKEIIFATKEIVYS